MAASTIVITTKNQAAFRLALLVAISSAMVLGLVANTRAALLDPLVDIGDSSFGPQGRRVSVNVPGIFSMELNTRGPPGSHQGIRMEESVMSGLVRVFIDKARNSNGTLQGPVRVSVMGMPMYVGRETLPPNADSGNNQQAYPDQNQASPNQQQQPTNLFNRVAPSGVMPSGGK